MARRLVLDDFYHFDVCSRVKFKLCNPARRPAFIKTPRLLGSMPSYWYSRVATTADLHLLFSPEFHSPSRTTNWTIPLMGSYTVLSIPIPSETFCRSRLENSPRGMEFLLCALPALLSKVKAPCVLASVLTRGVCCACLCPAAGRAHRTLALCILSDVTHLNS
jgi:hypothetical protein